MVYDERSSQVCKESAGRAAGEGRNWEHWSWMGSQQESLQDNVMLNAETGLSAVLMGLVVGTGTDLRAGICAEKQPLLIYFCFPSKLSHKYDDKRFE